MKPEMHYLLLLAASPLLMFVLHMITGRIYVKLNLRSSPLVSAIWAVLLSYAILAVAGWKIFLHSMDNQSGKTVAILYGILVAAFLGGSYYILFAMTEAARRIKILQEIHRKGEVTLQEINRDYGANQLLSVRLERLLALHQLEFRDGRYYIKGRTLYWVAVLVSAWSRLLR